MEKHKIKVIVFLHFTLMIYSISAICSKLASKQVFFSPRFVLLYGCVVLILGFYALCWQQIIKRINLTLAYANKAVTVIWGMIWGCVFFGENITKGKAVGVVLVMIGIIVYGLADGENGINK